MIGIDIGGANLKVATRDGIFIHYCPLWQGSPIREVLRRYQFTGEEAAVVMSGELADCFSSREEGIRCIVDSVREVFPGAQFYGTDAAFHDCRSARTGGRKLARFRRISHGSVPGLAPCRSRQHHHRYHPPLRHGAPPGTHRPWPAPAGIPGIHGTSQDHASLPWSGKSASGVCRPRSARNFSQSVPTSTWSFRISRNSSTRSIPRTEKEKTVPPL